MKRIHKLSKSCRSFFSLILFVLVPFITKGQELSDTLIIIGVGDVMPGTNFPSDKYLPADSGKNIFSPVKNILKDADLTIGNLEGCLLNSGGNVKKCQDSTKCYAFRIPTYFGGIIKEAGFDVLNLANNHSGDFGETGRISTTKTLDSLGIYYAGLKTCASVIFTINQVRIGFCGFSPFTGTMDMMSIDTVKNIVHTLDSICDIVIVSMHAGAEGANYTHVRRQTEMFYDEDRGNVYEFAHSLVDAGADIVFGHGPHVTKAVELYKNRFIAYSLGNFCTYARFNLNGANGVAPIVKVFVNPKGEFLKAKVFSIMQTGEGGPLIDNSNTAIQQLKELTETDFPETPLLIDNKGNITKK
jgi:poly-gamma-glutamate capsule biosynthesis protein CapA/YwtB (metallophosphatase superfamily)